MAYEPIPATTMQCYCDCANKLRDESQPVVTEAVLTTWICKATEGRVKGRSAREYYWECINCGKRRSIGVWALYGFFDPFWAFEGDGAHLTFDRK